MKRGLEAPLEEAISSKRGDSERKRIILELCSRGLGSREIARQVGGLTEGAVRHIRDAEEKKKFAAQAGPGKT